MSLAVSTLSVATLGVPAMLAAGLGSSAHCALMCGALYARRGRAVDPSALLGRLMAYAALGALAGGAGQWLLRVAAWGDTGQLLRLALLPPVVWMLVRAHRTPPPRPCCADAPTRDATAGPARRLAIGFATALLPCPLLLAAAGYAMLSGGALPGASLLLAFGVGTTPAVQAGAWMWARAAARPRWGPGVTAAASGAALFAALGAPTLLGWCIGA